MKLYALHTMFIDQVSGTAKLGDIKIFNSRYEASVKRDLIVMELRDDYDFEEDAVAVMDYGNIEVTSVTLDPDSFYEIKIQEVEI